MKRRALLPGAYLADQILGDPEWFPHPVRLMGTAIVRGERLLRRPGQSAAAELVAGAALAVAVVASSYWLTARGIRLVRRKSVAAGDAVELLLGWTCLAARNLEQEAYAVTSALGREELPLSRIRLARIVGRDTERLEASEISRAVIETLAESASDGVVAPLFWLAVGGVPLAMAYKAVNTLDSMIGHADQRYFYFGKAAARLDDAANLLPARFTALALIAASLLVEGADPGAAWRTWLRDGGRHKSPNAGQPEAAMAGALRVRLGGDNRYAGELIRSPRMGAEFEAATPAKAVQAIRLVAVASLMALAAATLLTRRRV